MRPRYQYNLNWESEADRDVIQVLKNWELAVQDRAVKEMEANARDLGNRMPLRAPNGFGGEVHLMVHPASFHHWGQRLGYDCWKDPQFLHEYLRDNPAARVNYQPRETTVRVHRTIVPALPRSTPGFTKQYQ